MLSKYIEDTLSVEKLSPIFAEPKKKNKKKIDNKPNQI
jgi:hypothetical protein